MRNILIAFALFAMLVVAMGCTQAGTQTGETGETGGTGTASKVTSEDLGALEDPDSESLDTGIPLEDI